MTECNHEAMSFSSCRRRRVRAAAARGACLHAARNAAPHDPAGDGPGPVPMPEPSPAAASHFSRPLQERPRRRPVPHLHAALDRAVLDAYGWSDVPTDCDFLLDHEIDEAAWGRKKKPWCHRWPDPVRDEVLARFLALNADRAADEARAGVAGHAKPTPGRPRRQADSR